MNHLPAVAFKKITFITGLLMLGNVHAHHVWIEQEGNQATLYFGEFADNLREVSPGRLDRFVKPSVQKVSSWSSNMPMAQASASRKNTNEPVT